jgi:hypothetical protein
MAQHAIEKKWKKTDKGSMNLLAFTFDGVLVYGRKRALLASAQA